MRNNFLVLNKTSLNSSCNLVNKVKRIFNIRKAGHTGTLDPLATGLVVIALGEATKCISYIQDTTKIYEFAVEFGKYTDTYDKEGKILEENDLFPSYEALKEKMQFFEGKIKQIPPIYSAVKLNGVSSYKLARNQDFDNNLLQTEINKKIRDSEIFSFEVLEYKEKYVKFKAHVSSGTYIRSLAVDLAKTLGCLAHVTSINRIKCGKYGLDDSIKLDKLEESDYNELVNFLKPIDDPLSDISVMHFEEAIGNKLKTGLEIKLDSKKINLKNILTNKNLVRAYVKNQIIGICKADFEKNSILPIKIFNL